MSTSKIVAILDQRPRVYKRSELYQSVVLGGAPADQAGKFIPALGSIVIDDDETRAKGAAYYVTAVTSDYDAVLTPIRIVASDYETRVLDFGNDLLMVYFQRNSNTKIASLRVDARLTLFGATATTYRLFRYRDDGSEETLSNTQTSSANGPILTPGKITLASVTDISGKVSYKNCPICYTAATLTNGEELVIEFYDSLNAVMARATIFAHQGIYVQNTSPDNYPVTGLSITASQMIGDKPYLKTGQDIATMIFYGRIRKVGATVDQDVIVNGANMCLFGRKDVNSSIPGRSFPLLLKYFPADNIAVDGNILEYANGVRFLTAETQLVIRSSMSALLSKVSLVPNWDAGNNIWVVRGFAYTADRSGYAGIYTFPARSSNYPIQDQNPYDMVGEILEGPFNPASLAKQTFKIGIARVEGSDVVQHTQSVIMQLTAPNASTNFTIADADAPTTIFGSAVAPNTPACLLEVNRTAKTYRFYGQADLSMFLTNFYWNASPPVVEGEAPTPTHFVIRNAVNGSVLYPTTVGANPVALSEALASGSTNMTFGSALTINNTVLVEFYVLQNAQYKVLYGVPVMVRSN